MNIQEFKSLPEDKKWWHKNSEIPNELNDVPMFVNKTTEIKNSDFITLHNSIVELIHKFVTEHNIDDSYLIRFSIDSLGELKKFGINTSYCDTSLEIIDNDNNTLLLSM